MSATTSLCSALSLAPALILSITILMLGACASVPVDRPVARPVPQSVVVDGEGRPLEEAPNVQTYRLPKGQVMSPVAQGLLASARQQVETSNWEGAANSLERALRIEPRNAVLWERLANVRYEQRDWRQAIQLAAKSNTLAGTNETLRRQNWYLMANAYDLLGDNEKAQKYRDKLNQQY